MVTQRAIELSSEFKLRGSLAPLSQSVRGEPGDLVGEGNVGKVTQHRSNHPAGVTKSSTIERIGGCRQPLAIPRGRRSGAGRLHGGGHDRVEILTDPARRPRSGIIVLRPLRPLRCVGGNAPDGPLVRPLFTFPRRRRYRLTRFTRCPIGFDLGGTDGGCRLRTIK